MDIIAQIIGGLYQCVYNINHRGLISVISHTQKHMANNINEYNILLGVLFQWIPYNNMILIILIIIYIHMVVISVNITLTHGAYISVFTHLHMVLISVFITLIIYGAYISVCHTYIWCLYQCLSHLYMVPISEFVTLTYGAYISVYHTYIWCLNQW